MGGGVMEGWSAAALAGLFGLALGSFLNVCALRWSQDGSVLRPRSHCPSCGTTVVWYDNVPVVSWIVLRGRCRRCGGGISFHYPAVELATGLGWAGLVLLHGPSAEALRGALFLTLLLGITVADARFYIIPDQFSVGGAVLGLVMAPLTPALQLFDAAVGAATGFGVLWAVATLGRWAFKKEAMGGGDIKMMAMVGAFLGPSGVFLTIFLGALLGTVVFGPISYRTGKLVPFGIFLAAGAAVTYGWGDALLSWYWEWAMGPPSP